MKKTLVILALSLFSLNSHANYFKGAVGYTLSGETEYSGNPSPANNGTQKIDSAFLTPLVLAYGIEVYENFFIEIEGAYRSNEYKEANLVDPKAFTFGANFVGNVPLTDVVVLTGGLGVNYGIYGDFTNSGDEENTFGAQVFAGADFKIQDDISLGGEIRYFTTMKDIDFGAGYKAEYSDTALLFTAKFSM